MQEKKKAQDVSGDAALPSSDIRIEAGTSEAARAVTERLVKTEKECRVAVAQIATYPGKISTNTEKIISCIHDAKLRGATVVVFPELAIPGYCSMDLLFNENYIRENINALQKIREETAGITVVVGFVDRDHDKKRSGGRPVLYNSAAVIHDGKIVGIQDKTLLPNYEIFFEDRYFAPPRREGAIRAGNLLIGTEICEDLWNDGYSQNPTERLVDDHPDLIVNISASPFHIGKLPVRHALVKSAAEAAGVSFIYANLVGTYDGYEGEVVFDGRSIVMGPNGSLKGVGKGFKDDLLIVDLYGPQELELPHMREAEELYEALKLGIKDYFERFLTARGPLFNKAIIGLSGGIDSAVVAAIAADALGPDRVLGITMPSKYSSSETRSDAEVLAQNLDVQLKTVPIQKEFDACLDTLREDLEIQELSEDVAEENVQARLRMINLMFFANKLKGLVLNTGNKTELALDNCTIYGDMVGGFSVLGDVDKDRVYLLARYINERAGREVIPWTTIDRVPSAELKPGQDDSMVMGAMPQVIAPMIRTIVEEGLTFPQAVERFGHEFPPELIRSSFQKLDRSEWKRRQAAPAIRVTPHAFGNGRKMPMGHGYIG